MRRSRFLDIGFPSPTMNTSGPPPPIRRTSSRMSTGAGFPEGRERGKTTLALALAMAHERAGGQAAVIDLDPQGSAATWGRLRHGVPPVVISAHPPRLARVIAAAADAGATLAVIDTARREAGGAAECNGVAERFMRTLKEECIHLHDFETLEEAREVIGAFIERYNNGWLLQRHGYLTPARARQKLSRRAA